MLIRGYLLVQISISSLILYSHTDSHCYNSTTYTPACWQGFLCVCVGLGWDGYGWIPAQVIHTPTYSQYKIRLQYMFKVCWRWAGCGVLVKLIFQDEWLGIMRYNYTERYSKSGWNWMVERIAKTLLCFVYLYNYAFQVFSKIKLVQLQDKQPNFVMIRIIYEMELKCCTTLRCMVITWIILQW